MQFTIFTHIFFLSPTVIQTTSNTLLVSSNTLLVSAQKNNSQAIHKHTDKLVHNQSINQSNSSSQLYAAIKPRQVSVVSV